MNLVIPCLEKKCSICCNPVKVSQNFPEDKLPKDKGGKDIWKFNNELLAPEDEIDTTRLRAYECKYYNKKTGKCDEYENRPEICRNTSCIDKKSNLSSDEQHKQFVSEKFASIKIPEKYE